MKKYIYILSAAAVALAMAGCAKEELRPDAGPLRELRTLTCSFDAGTQAEDEATRTDITKQGKTVWSAGDRLWVSNGTESDTLTVAQEYDGQKFCEFKTELTGKLYVVYPLSAAKGVDGEKLIVDVQRIQDGTFGSANIAVAVAEDRYVKMRNVTSVLKFRIPADAKPIKVVSINAVNNVVAGLCSVDMSSGNPEVAASNTSSDVLVKVDGLAGNFYASVVPGTYNAGFTMSAISLDLKNACEVKTTTVNNELKANDFFDLGRVGSELKPLQGDGTKGNPWQISSLPEMLAFTYYVNEGNSMKDQYIKVVKDINGVTIPVGTYDDGTKKGIAFKGSFDGGDKTITLAMRQAEGKNALALFANVADSAYVHNVNVAGSVKSNWHYAAGLIAVLNSGSPIKVENCKSSATVDAYGFVGGIAAFTTGPKGSPIIEFDNCVNEGSVTGTGWYVGGVIGAANNANLKNCSNSGSIKGSQCVGGVAGNAYIGSMSDCSNAGDVTATDGAGLFGAVRKSRWTFEARGGAAGLAGYAQNISFKRCTNSGDISGVNKTGGIAGTLYWGKALSCSNSGKVSVSEDAAGGIIGWNLTHGVLYDCLNTGEITAKRSCAGGIAGQAQSYHPRNSASINYMLCYNEGKINSDGQSAGGVAGYIYVMNNLAKVTINGCINRDKAEVTGLQYVGGILGSEGRYSNWSRAEILNCENHGYIFAKKKGAKAELCAGGIFGGPINFTSKQGVMIWNCYNTANVEYADSAATKPCVGGIAGKINHGASGQIYNIYNSGAVRPKKGTPVATSGLGAIIGQSVSGGSVNFVYYLEGTCAQAIGVGSNPASAAVASVVDATGNLVTPATVKGNSYITVAEALNAWRKGNLTYYGWTAGPVFVYPTYTDPIDSGNFDIGNGGEI